MAKLGMDIQEEEIREKLLEEQEIQKKKNHKFDVFEAVDAASKKDYGWFAQLGENETKFSPHMLNLFLGFVWNKRNPQRRFNTDDKVYADIVQTVNNTSNAHVYCSSKAMYWLLACTIQEYNAPFTVDYKHSTKKFASEKYNPKVIDYMSQQLLTSKNKIYEMIDVYLITDKDMTEIEKDLETIENPKKKK
jgi:hypothetical protein